MIMIVCKQGEHGEAKIRSRQTTLNAVDERWKIDRSVTTRSEEKKKIPQPSVSPFYLLI